MRKALTVAFLLTCLGSLKAIEPQVNGPLNSATSAKTDDKHSAKFGDLAVTVTSMGSKTGTSPDRREATIFLTVTNAGKDQAICASLTAKLETTFALEYEGIVAKAPRIRELLPGESTNGSYDFDVKNGVQPLELVLGLERHTLACSANAPTQPSIPNEVRVDVQNLPLPPIDLRSILPQTTRPVGSGVSYPACLYCPEPGYTEAARRAGFEGTVVLHVIIQVDGHPGSIEVAKGSGRADLDQKAIEAVRMWRFKPAIGPNGTPVATMTPVEVNFRLH